MCPHNIHPSTEDQNSSLKNNVSCCTATCNALPSMFPHIGRYTRSRVGLAKATLSKIGLPSRSYSASASCRYHSYPDPNEKPIINTSTSNHSKVLDKTNPEFSLNSVFKMDNPFPGVPVSKGINASAPPPTLYTTLNNGLTVASQDIPGMMSSIALIVRTGSAYEDQSGSQSDSTGSSHFIELNAFRSTKNRPYQQLIQELELLGGMVQCIASRENIIFVMDVMRHQVEQAMDILADTVLNPIFPEDELEEARQIVELQQTELPSEVFSRDLVQRAAYKGSRLGNAHYCPIDTLPEVNAQRLQAFRAKYFFPGNCILAVSGLDHESAVNLAKKKMSDFSSVCATSNSASAPKLRQRDGLDLNEVSTYTGGMLTQERELKEPFVKLAMAFPVGGWCDPLLVPTCVLQQLLGGGSSFSAGGPGKGMFSRLYTQVLNKQYWSESVEAFLSIHEHAGLVGIDGACPPDKLVNLVQVITQQFTTLALVPVSAEELSRAKNMLKSSMMMQLESRLVQCEDIARQFVTYGHRDSQALMCDKIDAVTAADIMQVATLMMKQPPSVGVVGNDLSRMPSYEQIAGYTKAFYEQSAKANTGSFTN